MANQLRPWPHGDGRPLQPEHQGLHLLKATHGQPRATLAMLQVAAQSDDFSHKVDWGKYVRGGQKDLRSHPNVPYNEMFRSPRNTGVHLHQPGRCSRTGLAPCSRLPMSSQTRTVLRWFHTHPSHGPSHRCTPRLFSPDPSVDVAVFVDEARRGAEPHLRSQGGLPPMPAQPPPADVIGDAHVCTHRVVP